MEKNSDCGICVAENCPSREFKLASEAVGSRGV